MVFLGFLEAKEVIKTPGKAREPSGESKKNQRKTVQASGFSRIVFNVVPWILLTKHYSGLVSVRLCTHTHTHTHTTRRKQQRVSTTPYSGNILAFSHVFHRFSVSFLRFSCRNPMENLRKYTEGI